MTDPFAPPTEGPARPRRHDGYGGYDGYEQPAVAGPTATTTYERETYPGVNERPAYDRSSYDREERRRHRDPPREVAKPGVFWVVAAIGIGLVCLARLFLYFAVADDIPDGLEAPALFATFGIITVAAGLTLAAVLQRGLTVPWRIALILGAAFLAIMPGGLGYGFGDLL